MRTERELAGYYRQIQKKILGTRQEKQAFLQRFQRDVEEYREQHPEAAFAEFQEHFGTPALIAEDYIAALDEGTVQNRLSHAKAVKIGMAVVAAAVVLTVASVGIAVVVGHKNATATDGYDQKITYMDGYTEQEVTNLYQ